MIHKPTRRGILLLLILSLLAMFGMIAVAFVVLSNQTLRSTQALQRQEQAYHPPGNELDEAAMQAFRGTNNPNSKIGSHGLLEDIYGSNSISGMILPGSAMNPPPTPVCGGQLIEFASSVDLSHHIGAVMTITSPGTPAYGLSTRIVSFNPTNNNLQILAFPNIAPTLSALSSLAGKNFIVNGMPFSGTGAGYNPLSGQLDLYYAYNADPAHLSYELTTNPALTQYTQPVPVALLPNLPASVYSNRSTNPPDPNHMDLSNGTGMIPFPQLNEDYDLPDYQNYLLATPPLSVGVNVSRIIPSMHRPALVNYWYWKLFTLTPTGSQDKVWYPLSGIKNSADRWSAIFHPVAAYKAGKIKSPPSPLPPRWTTAPTPEEIVNYILQFKRMIIARPMTDDHPYFNGSNPSSLLSSGVNDTTKSAWECGDFPQWDVDTDGDGIPDSIWIDIGLPVRTTPDGKKYKPLVAYYVLDMDGRLNLNAHGNLAQSDSTIPYDSTVAGAQIRAGTTARFAAKAQKLTTQAPLLRGQGYGPADINLLPLFSSSATPLLDYRNLFCGTNGIEGRYGLDQKPGIYGQNFLGINKNFNLPDTYSTANYQCGYSNPVDLKGTMAIGLDLRGQPLYQDPTIPVTASTQNILLPDPAVPASASNSYFGQLETNPYAINLGPTAVKGVPSSNSATALPDNPFSVAELERILRPYDRDSTTLPDRLQKLASYLVNLRHRVTTESHDVPFQVPPKISTAITGGTTFSPTVDLNNPAVPLNAKIAIRTWFPPKNLLDLLTAKYYDASRKPPTSSPATLATCTAARNTAVTNAKQLFPPELLAGLKMNLNRPLDNWEGHVFQLYSQPGTLSNVTASYNPEGYQNGFLIDPTTGNPVPFTTIPAAQQAKQVHARHLYVLMMMLRELGAVNINEVGTGNDRDELTARRIAQWAINAVDFMTPDSVMTPFEYDINPLTAAGWRVDGNLLTADHEVPTNPATPVVSRVVWGAKPVDLLLMENINFHDRRVADTDMDSSNKKRTDADTTNKPPIPADMTLDQPQIPQGSTFIEFYCTRNDTNPQAPRDLYTPYNNKWRLDLGKMAPQWSQTTYQARLNTTNPLPNHLKNAYPVWRLVIGENNVGANKHDNNNAVLRFSQSPKTFTPQTEQIKGISSLPTDLLDDKTHPITIDRIIWFQNTVPPVTQAKNSNAYHADAERIYYNQGTTPVLVAGGEYLVAGPRETTHIGCKSVLPSAITPKNFWGDPSPQVLSLNPLTPPSVNFVNNSSASIYPNANQIKTPVAIIIAADLPPTWTQHANGKIGLSISEPIPGVNGGANYYIEPTITFPAGGVKEWYGKPDDSTTRTFLSEPEDSKPGKPLKDDGLLASQTTLNYKTFFLQRLANPSEPFEPTINPYITVDWMPADLTVFNGMDYMSQADWDNVCKEKGFDLKANLNWDPDDPLVAKPNNNLRLASRQRGDGTNSVVTNQLWAQLSLDPAKSSQDIAATNLVFPYNLNTTLGYINTPFWDWSNGAFASLYTTAHPTTPWTDWDGTTPPWLGNTDPTKQPWITAYTVDDASGTAPVPPVTPYYGDPVTPYPWLTWNNRPYNTPYELMLVPSSDPSRLLAESQINKPLTMNIYMPNPANPSEYPFPALLDFFVSSPLDTSMPGNPAPSLYRIFDYIQVPSPFTDAEIQANPTNPGVWNNPGAHYFHPPFNNISTYRETGRINLNTIFDQQIFTGLMNYFPGNWQNFVQSRRGYAATNMTDYNKDVPTEFARPFRSPANAYLAPPMNNIMGNKSNELSYDREISASQLRATPDANNPQATSGTLLFDYTSTGPWDEKTRSPYFNYLGVQRLANLTTTRSNVYAVWVTVGYFEVKPAPTAANLPNADHPWMNMSQLKMTAPQFQQLIQQIYPDGYELGQELGSDTGEITRHRAFYIFDRSIPVGFQRGQDLNVDKAILLKRFIE